MLKYLKDVFVLKATKSRTKNLFRVKFYANRNQLDKFGIEIPIKGTKMKQVKQPTLRELILMNRDLILSNKEDINEIKNDMTLLKSLPTIKKEIEEVQNKKS